MQAKELLATLMNVKNALASKEVIEQSTSFVFCNGRVHAANLIYAISEPLDIKVKGGVPAEKLIKFLSKLKGKEEIEIYKKASELRIDGSSFESGLTMESEVKLDMDRFKIPKGLKFENLTKKIIKGIEICALSAKTAGNNDVLANVHFNSKHNCIESCDYGRATRFKIDEFKFSFLLPVNIVRTIIDYNYNKIAITKNMLFFKNDNGAILSIIRSTHEYPDINEYGYFDGKGKPFFLPDEIVPLLDTGDLFSEEKGEQNVVQITLEDNVCAVKGQNENGWYEEVAETERTYKKTITFQTSAPLLKDIMKVTKKGYFSEEKLTFVTKEYTHIIVAYA